MLLNISVHKVSAAPVSILLCSQSRRDARCWITLLSQWILMTIIDNRLTELYGMIGVDLEGQSNGVLVFSFLMAKFQFQNLTNLNSSSIPSRLSGYPNPQNHRYLREMLSKAWTLTKTRWRRAWIADLRSAIWYKSHNLKLQEASGDDGMMKYFLCWGWISNNKTAAKTKQTLKVYPYTWLLGTFPSDALPNFQILWLNKLEHHICATDPKFLSKWCWKCHLPFQINHNILLSILLFEAVWKAVWYCWVFLVSSCRLTGWHTSYAMQNLRNIFLLRQAAALLRPPLNSRSIARAAEWERSSVNQT